MRGAFCKRFLMEEPVADMIVRKENLFLLKPSFPDFIHNRKACVFLVSGCNPVIFHQTFHASYYNQGSCNSHLRPDLFLHDDTKDQQEQKGIDQHQVVSIYNTAGEKCINGSQYNGAEISRS